MRPNRPQIRLGIPRGTGVGDTFLLTPLCRYADVTYEVASDSACGADLASVLQSVARVEWVREPLTIDESLSLYASQYGPVPGISRLPQPVHEACAWPQRFGMEVPNCIPYALPPGYEMAWAERWLKQYRNPIVFTPIPGGLKNAADGVARTKFVPAEQWEATLATISQTHDLLYFTAADNYVPMPYTLPLLGFPVAKIAAVMHSTRRHLGVENGLLHLAVAMGATCQVALPMANGQIAYNGHPCYAYRGDMWRFEPCRVFYHQFETRDAHAISFT